MTDIAAMGQTTKDTARFSQGSRMVGLVSRAGLTLAILAVILYGSLANPVFFSAGNFVNVLMSMSIVVIVLAVLKNVPGGKKGTKFRRSKRGG